VRRNYRLCSALQPMQRFWAVRRQTLAYRIMEEFPVIQEFLESIHTSRLIGTDLPSTPSLALVRDDG